MVDPELKTLLEANYELSKENNRILKKMQRSQRNALIFRILYWLLAAGLIIPVIYYLLPYLKKIQELLPVFNDFSGFLKQ